MTDDSKRDRGDRLVIDDPHYTPCPQCQKDARESRFGAPCYECVPMHPIAAMDAARKEVQTKSGPDMVRGWDLAGGLSEGRCVLVLNGGSDRHREIADLIKASGRDVDVVTVDGADYRREDLYVRWEPKLDPRVRADHGAFGFASTWWDDAPEPPPFHLGRFNCRGDYVWPGMPETERPLTLMRQSGGQIAEVLDTMTRRVIDVMGVTEQMLRESVPAEAFHRETARRGAALSKRIDDALLKAARGVEGFPPSRLTRVPESGSFDVSGTITAHFQNPALLRAIRAGQGSLNSRAFAMIRPHLTKRAYRRLRGKARALRRWQYRR